VSAEAPTPERSGVASLRSQLRYVSRRWLRKIASIFVDGVSQSLSGTGGGFNNTGNMASATLYLMSRNNASLFGTGRLHNVIVYAGVNLTQQNVDDLYAYH
jgi:uncharacterized membrane protein